MESRLSHLSSLALKAFALGGILFSYSQISLAAVNITGSWNINSTYELEDCTDATYDATTYTAVQKIELVQHSDGTVTGTKNTETITINNGLALLDGPGGTAQAGTFTRTGTGDINLLIDSSGNISSSRDTGISGSATNSTMDVTDTTRHEEHYERTSDGVAVQCFITSRHNGTKTDTTLTTEQPSTAVVNSTSTLQSTITATTTFINSRISNILKGSLGGGFTFFKTGGMFDATFGRAAGETLEGIGIWGSYSNMAFKNTGSSTEYNGGRHNVMLGADFQPLDNTILGLSLGYELTDIDTGFNDGALNSQGYSLTPYLGIAIDKNWSLDAIVGYSSLDIDQFRVDSGSRISSSTSAERWFVSSNLTYGTVIGDLYLEGHGGLLRAVEAQKAYTESNNSNQERVFTGLSQMQVGTKVTYLAFTNTQPYMGITYNKDTSTTSVSSLIDTSGNIVSYTDKDDYLVNAGIRYQRADNISAGVDISHRLARDDNKETTISMDFRLIF